MQVLVARVHFYDFEQRVLFTPQIHEFYPSTVQTSRMHSPITSVALKHFSSDQQFSLSTPHKHDESPLAHIGDVIQLPLAQIVSNGQ